MWSLHDSFAWRHGGSRQGARGGLGDRRCVGWGRCTHERRAASSRPPHSGPCRVLTDLFKDRAERSPICTLIRGLPPPRAQVVRRAAASLASIFSSLVRCTPRFAAVHRPPDSRSERLVKQQRSSFAAARPQSVFGARAPSPNVDDGDESSTPNCVLGAEFAHEFDWLDRHDDRNDKWTQSQRCDLERRRCGRATGGREQFASAIFAPSRWPRLRAGSAAWALEQQRRKRQSDDDKEKSKKAKAAAAEQGGPHSGLVRRCTRRRWVRSDAACVPCRGVALIPYSGRRGAALPWRFHARHSRFQGLVRSSRQRRRPVVILYPPRFRRYQASIRYLWRPDGTLRSFGVPSVCSTRAKGGSRPPETVARGVHPRAGLFP